MADDQPENKPGLKKPVFTAPWAAPENPVSVLLNENCAVKSALSIVMGGGFGFLFGMFFHSMGPTTGFDPRNQEGTTREQVTRHFKEMGRNGARSAKGFAAAAGLFSASECVLERVRGKHDIYNTLTSGCFSGAVLGGRGGGLQGAAFGCMGFAGFSLIFDLYLERDAKTEVKREMPTDEDAEEEDVFAGSWVQKSYEENKLPELVYVPPDEDDYDDDEYEDDDDE